MYETVLEVGIEELGNGRLRGALTISIFRQSFAFSITNWKIIIFLILNFMFMLALFTDLIFFLIG